MKKILIRRSGEALSSVQARALVKNVKDVYPSVQHDEHRAPHGYPLPAIAEKANLQAIKEAHPGYICVYEGTDYVAFEGFKALFIGFKDLPPDFETHFPEYVVVGE